MMKRKISSLLLVLTLVLGQTSMYVVTAEEAATEEAVIVYEEQDSEAVFEEQVENPEAVPAVQETVPEQTQEETPSEGAPEENVPAAQAQNTEPQSEEQSSAAVGAAKDVYIDNTVDNSVAYVTGAIHLTGSGGKQAGYDEQKEIYKNQASVTYSNPKTAEVQGMIDAAETQVYQTALDIKNRGKSGEFHMSTSESTGKVWDNRKYETVEDDDAVLIGDTDYLTGAYGVNDDYTRTHIASGDYGKETFFQVEVNGWVEGYRITVSTEGRGIAKADLEASLSEETVTLTAEPENSYSDYVFKKWEVVSGGAVLADVTAATTTFTMPAADVEVKAVFESRVIGCMFGASEGGSYALVTNEYSHEAMSGGSGNTGSMNATLHRGETATVTATPAAGYRFKGWYGGVMGASHFLEGDDGTLISMEASYTFTCDDNISLYAVFEKEDHTHTLAKTDEVPATCEQDGTKAYWTCTECGKLFSDAEGTTEIKAPQKITAPGHDWDESVVTTEATCEEPGVRTYTCKNDKSHTKTEEIAAPGHDWGDWVTTVEPTETADGTEERVCKNDPAHVETRTIPAITIEYRNTSGDGSTYTKGSEDSLAFTFKRSHADEVTFDHFTGAMVDGAELDSSAYSAESGSVIITLLPAYLETLSAGEYTLTAMFDDGNDADASFTVKEKKDQKKDDTEKKEKNEAKPTQAPAKTRTPATGDDSRTGLFTVLFAASLLTILAALIYRRRAR